MSIISNITQSVKEKTGSNIVPGTYLDTLYDYAEFLDQGNICTLSESLWGKMLLL